jgi:aminoglycoside/choline kinase family phosphotransferase
VDKTKSLLSIFNQHYKFNAEKMLALPRSGSYREYYRIRGQGKTAIGVYNYDRKENEAFLEFTRHFLSLGLLVPEIYIENLDENVYLLQDLGDISLFSFLNDNRENDDFPPSAIELYKNVLEQLPAFQIKGNAGLDYTKCYPRDSFDKQSMMWDLSYFKYYFLKLARVPFDEQELENDFESFSDWLLQADCDYFLYRDFQSRNVMVHEGNPYFIDYQGGRKGALQYDVASLLFDAKADIPPKVRDELLEHYLSHLGKYKRIKEKKFREYFTGFALIRLMQAMGAFGFRGFYEKKPHFLASIPYAVSMLTYILDHHAFPAQFPHLLKVLGSLADAPELKQFSDTRKHNGRLVIEINSFSYRRGIPIDQSENGGGFVFDCRAIHNPGRYNEFKNKTGTDREVINFLKEKSEADQFIGDAFTLVKRSVDVYLARNFSNLMVNFGCTGGQHRSVYCAEQLKTKLMEEFGGSIEIYVHHREQELKELGIL